MLPFYSQSQIDEALTHACGICRQPRGETCRDLQGAPVSSVVHHYRVENEKWVK